jgi:hypothetical protein
MRKLALAAAAVLLLLAAAAWWASRRPAVEAPAPASAPPAPTALEGLEATREPSWLTPRLRYRHPGAAAEGSRVELYVDRSGASYTLRMLAAYEGDRPVGWTRIRFTAGGKTATLDPGDARIERASERGTVRESVDLPVVSGAPGKEGLHFRMNAAPALAVLLHAETATMRFEGERSVEREIPADELARFREVGGKFLAVFEERADGVSSSP